MQGPVEEFALYVIFLTMYTIVIVFNYGPDEEVFIVSKACVQACVEACV